MTEAERMQAIGQELALKASALGMRVIGTKREPVPVEGVEAVYSGDEITGATCGGFRS